MDYQNDKRIVMTLDAGGTNFVFSAIQSGKEIVDPITSSSNAHDLSLCLSTIEKGFAQTQSQLSQKPAAISFAFPGPADYPNGIIGDLGNLPCFRGGIALGPMLQEKFNIPVFINNDGDLYAYGEAIAGYLPYINNLLEKAGSTKRFQNLVGFTLGTGFGAGIVSQGKLLRGDNSGAGEVWLLRSKLSPEMNVEENVSIRAIQRFYSQKAGLPVEETPSPKEIYEIGTGHLKGDQNAAMFAFDRMGEELGNAIANVLTLIDGIAVIGGGIAGAHLLFFTKMIDEMNSTYTNFKKATYRRLVPQAYNLENEKELEQFLMGHPNMISVPGSGKKVHYDDQVRLGVGVSRIGTSKAVSIGAYAFALNELTIEK